MKKYSILFILTAFAGCSLLPPEMISKEFIAEDIKGETIPAALDNLTLVYGSPDLRFTSGYVALKGDTFDTYAARIVKIAPGSGGEFKLFISDGSRQKGKLRVNALYVTNAGKNIYGIGTSNDVNINSSFPQVYTPFSIGDSRDKINLGWAVDEAHKPNPLPGSHQGTYKSTPDPYIGTRIFTVSAAGIVVGSEGGQYGGYSPEQKFLRVVVVSGTDYECYTANGAYKITANDLYSWGAFVDYNPATDVTFGLTPDATR